MEAVELLRMRNHCERDHLSVEGLVLVVERCLRLVEVLVSAWPTLPLGWKQLVEQQGQDVAEMQLSKVFRRVHLAAIICLL